MTPSERHVVAQFTRKNRLFVYHSTVLLKTIFTQTGKTALFANIQLTFVFFVCLFFAFLVASSEPGLLSKTGIVRQ
jgi:hypothetical protein